MSYLIERTAWDSVLSKVCSINKWERRIRKCWSTDNGSWHSMERKDLQDLKKTLATLSRMAKGDDRQWIIEANVLDFIKNILAWPSPDEKHYEIMSSAWQLLFDLVYNSTNHTIIWIVFHETLMEYLEQYHCNIDTCLHIVYSIYGIARVAEAEGIRILKILLSHFQIKKQMGPLTEQGLTIFLEHFMTDEKDIISLYQQLNDDEKICFMHFIVDCISKPQVNGIRDCRISRELLHGICNDFNSKNEDNSASSSFTSQHSTLMQALGLFEVIAYASTDERHQLNDHNFRLLLNVVHFFDYVRSNDETVEQSFKTSRRNSKRPLKEIILSTIINLVRGNTGHKDKARDAGLIEILVNGVSSEPCPYLYKCTLYALIEMCQVKRLNMELVKEIAEIKDWTGSVSVKDFIYDMNYKGTKVY